MKYQAAERREESLAVRDEDDAGAEAEGRPRKQQCRAQKVSVSDVAAELLDVRGQRIERVTASLSPRLVGRRKGPGPILYNIQKMSMGSLLVHGHILIYKMSFMLDANQGRFKILKTSVGFMNIIQAL